VSAANETSEGDDQLEQVRATAAATDRESTRPGRRATRWSIFLGLAVTVLALDQLAKAWLVSALDPGEAIAVIGDWLRLVHGRNDGGLFGLFKGSAELFAAASVGVIAFIVVYHARSRPSLLLSISLGLLLGGALGNLVDRVRYGHVIDFVDAGIGTLRFYTFNLADSAITLSILLLIALALFPGLAGSSTDGPDA
jgi:signal peptidase II